MSTTDARRPGFFTVDNDILERHGKTLGVYGVAVYTALAQHANSDGRCFPAVPRIAGMLDCSPRKVHDAIRKLAELGLVAVEERRAENGRQLSNGYVLLPVCPAAPSEVTAKPMHVMQGEGACHAGGRVHVVHPNNTQKEQTPSFAEAQEGREAHGADAPDAPPAGIESNKPKRPARKPRSGTDADPRVRELTLALADWQGYTACNWPAEAKHAKQIIDAGYTLDDARTVWRRMKGEAFWADQHLSLASVFKQLGAKLGAANGRKREAIVLEPIRRGGGA